MKQILWILFAITCGLHLYSPLADPDLWWHITVGRWILAHHAVPHVDLWNMFSTGGVWRAYSWSVEILFALCDRWWGEAGLAALNAVFGLLLSLSFFAVFSRLARDYFMGLLLGAIVTIACQQNFSLRPQSLVWVLMAFCIVVADGVAKEGVSKRYLGLCALLGCMWANIHLTACVGLLTVFLWSIGDTHSKESVRRALQTSLAFLAGTFITPYMGGEWLTFFAKSAHPIHFKVIAEFKPATFQEPGMVIVVLIAVMLVVAAYRERRVPPLTQTVLTACLFLSGGLAVKFLPFAVISACGQCAVWWRSHPLSSSDESAIGIREALQRLKGFFSRLEPRTYQALSVFLLCVIVTRVVILRRGEYVNSEVVPKSAVDFIIGSKLASPVLNDFNTGGYLMYRRSDPVTGELLDVNKVTIDGRTNVNPDEVWNLQEASRTGAHNWRAYIDKVNPETILWGRDRPLTAILEVSPEWCCVFTSGSHKSGYAVFVKREEFERRRGEFASTDCLAGW